MSTYYFIENVLKIFLGAIHNLDIMHPINYIYNCLGCEIEELPKQKNCGKLITETDYIYNFIEENSYNKIKSVFKIKNSIHDKNFNPNNFKNRYIFFHGTKIENILGILSQGLKISPFEAKFQGATYGKGIYLSNSFNLSFNYCRSEINRKSE